MVIIMIDRLTMVFMLHERFGSYPVISVDVYYVLVSVKALMRDTHSSGTLEQLEA